MKYLVVCPKVFGDLKSNTIGVFETEKEAQKLADECRAKRIRVYIKKV